MITPQPDNKAVIQRFIRGFVNDKNNDLGADILTEDYTHHDPASPEADSGPGPWVAAVKGLHQALPDGEVHIGELIAEGDLVSVAATMTGTHQGAFRGIEQTGTAIEIRGNAKHRVSDGQIAETGATWDVRGLPAQIGAVEPRGE